MHNALKDRPNSKHLQLLPKRYYQKTSVSYCSNSNILLLQVGYKTRTTETENSLKTLSPLCPNKLLLKRLDHITEDNDHCYDIRTNSD